MRVGEFTLRKEKEPTIMPAQERGERAVVPWLVLIGVALVPSAALLLWGWYASRKDVSLMRTTETTPAADVAKLPPGSLVEVKGRLRCAEPVTGELSKLPCAHFTATFERDYETLEYDPGCKAAYRVRRTACELASSASALFEIEDVSGRAAVLPEGAIIEGVEAVARQEQSEAGAACAGAIGEDVTLCRRYKEMHLPLDVEIYVLGVVGDEGRIGAPPPGRKDQRFLISVKPEEARSAELGNRGKWMLGAGVACLIGAAISLGSASWLTLANLGRFDPPREVLQGNSLW